MPRQFGLLPGSGGNVQVLFEGLDAILEFPDLTAGLLVGAGGDHGGYLTFNLFQFLLRFFCGCHESKKICA
jgi:hypothetical protein